MSLAGLGVSVGSLSELVLSVVLALDTSGGGGDDSGGGSHVGSGSSDHGGGSSYDGGSGVGLSDGDDSGCWDDSV